MLRVAQQLTSDESTLRDYDFKRPGLLLEANVVAEGATGLEVYDDPGEFVKQPEGDRLAKVRLQELTIERRTGRGDANVPRFVPGSTFELAEHPLEALNAKWLLTEVEHEGHDPGLAYGFQIDRDVGPLSQAYAAGRGGVAAQPRSAPETGFNDTCVTMERPTASVSVREAVGCLPRREGRGGPKRLTVVLPWVHPRTRP